MRILLLTLEYPPIEGGVSRYLETFARALESHEVIVWVPKLSRWIYPRWIPIIFQTFFRVLRARPNLIVISHLLPCGYPVLVAKWLLRVPYVVMCHGLDLLAPLDRPWRHLAAEIILKNAKTIITNSQFTASLLAQYAQDPARAHVIPPIPQDFPRTQKTTIVAFGDPGGKYVLSVSRLVPRKGIDTALAAFAKIAAEFPDLAYVIAGDGPDRARLQSLTKQWGLFDRVRFLGNISQDELSAIYASATLFVLPTRAPHADVEGFGTVFLEAGLFGKAVVAGRSGGVEEAVVHGETGLLVPPYDPEATTRAIRELLNDPVRRERLGTSGQVRVRQQFTLQQIRKLLNKAIPPLTEGRLGGVSS